MVQVDAQLQGFGIYERDQIEAELLINGFNYVKSEPMDRDSILQYSWQLGKEIVKNQLQKVGTTF